MLHSAKHLHMKTYSNIFKTLSLRLMATDANSSDETILLDDSDDSPQPQAAEERSPTNGNSKSLATALKSLQRKVAVG